jgi:hypothetical protein
LKIEIRPLTPEDELNPKPISSPPKKKPCTRQQMLFMEVGDEEMEVDVTMQKDGNSI